LNVNHSAEKNLSNAPIAKNHKLLWTPLPAQRRLAVNTYENAKLFCKSQQVRGEILGVGNRGSRSQAYCGAVSGAAEA